MLRLASGLLVLAVLTLTFGCGAPPNKPAASAKVGGKVNLDGKAIGGGTIVFSKEGQPPKAIDIGADGNFSGDAYVGKNTVDIRWEKEDKTKPHPMEKGKYLTSNVVAAPKAPHSADVPEGGKTDLSFDATSK